MSDNINIDQCLIHLEFDRPIQPAGKAKDLRGAMAAFCKDNPLFHQHSAEGKVIYRYPLVQYKFIDNIGIIIGLGQGALPLAKIDLFNTTIQLGRDCYKISQQVKSFKKEKLGIVKELQNYHFLTPWLALNDENYKKYIRFGDINKKRTLLEKILVANIISMSKGIGYTVPRKIEVNIQQWQEETAILKENTMLGITARFVVNFVVPDYWGIGKSVSHGFGTLKRRLVNG